MNSTPDNVLWFIGLVGLFNFIALTFLAIRLRAPIAITVQSPAAVLPERLQQTLDALDLKLTPPKAKLDDPVIARLLYEGVALAEQSKLKGPDRFAIAKSFVLTRLATLNAEHDERDLAQRIEAAVALGKKKR